MPITFIASLDSIDWPSLKRTLSADRFDNGRTAEQLQKSFANSYAVCFAKLNSDIVGTARVLSDGVCNAYLIDVWTRSDLRRQGIGRTMVEQLIPKLPGQHIYLQADAENADFYDDLGFKVQPIGMSKVIGKWLIG